MTDGVALLELRPGAIPTVRTLDPSAPRATALALYVTPVSDQVGLGQRCTMALRFHDRESGQRWALTAAVPDCPDPLPVQDPRAVLALTRLMEHLLAWERGGRG